MTDGEPEPFRMSTGPDDDREPPTEDESDATDGASSLPGDAESIADLIDEASRTATEQAVQEATGTAPVDRSSDVWGGGGDEPDEDLDALWSAAADRHRGSHVFDDVLGPEDSWRSETRMPPAAAEPTASLQDASHATDDEPEPEVFKLHVDEDEPDDEPADEPRADDVADEPDDGGVWASPDEEQDDDLGWAATDDGTDGDLEDGGEAGPEPFRFAAGPATHAPAAVPDHVAAADAGEPDTFAFAFDETVAGADTDDGEDDPWTPAAQTDVPVWEDAARDEPWSTATDDDEAGAAPVVDEPDDHTGDDDWALDGDVEDDDGHDGPTDEQALAETATPRPDTGWDDRSAEQFTWALDSAASDDERDDDAFLAAASSGPDEDVEGFTAQLDDPDRDASEDEGFLPDDEPLPSHREPDPPFTTGSTVLGDVLDDLLGDVPTGPSPVGEAAPDEPGDSDIAGPAAADPAPVADAATPADVDDAAPPAGPTPAPVADPPTPTAPPPRAAADRLDAPPAAADRLDAPPAAADRLDAPPRVSPPPETPTPDDTDEERRTPGDGPAADEPSTTTPSDPGEMSFSSKQKKKRGLFGR